MAQETREKRKRIARTTRATNPVCWRMPIMSVARIVLKRKMVCPSAKVKSFLGVKNVTHEPNTRNQYDGQVFHSAAYEETGVGKAATGDLPGQLGGWSVWILWFVTQ